MDNLVQEISEKSKAESTVAQYSSSRIGEITEKTPSQLLSEIFSRVINNSEPQLRQKESHRIGGLKKIKSFAKTYTQALKHSAFILSVGAVTDRGRREIENVAALAASARTAKDNPTLFVPPAVPKIPAQALINLPYEIVIQKADAAHGNVSLLELMIICKLVRAINPLVSFEIGTFDGRTTLNIAANSVESARVFTLDLPRSDMQSVQLHLEESDRRHIEKDESGSVFVASPLRQKITQLFGDSATFDFSSYYGQVDLLFIDGSHSYEYVVSDSLKAIEMLGNNGVIFWHDYGAEWWPGVTKALNELYLSDTRFKGMRHIEGTTLVLLWRDAN